MPFFTGETEEGRRLVGADRATWVRLLVALALAGSAAAVPHVGWTSAEFTRSTQTTGVVRTAPDFTPDPPPADPALPAPEDLPGADD